MSKPLLEVVDVAIERGFRQLLTGISLTVSPGDLIQLKGANGVGKTSLLRALAGLARVGVEGRIERSVQPVYLGHLPGNKSLLTPEENLRWHPSGGHDIAVAGISDALSAVGLSHCADLPVHTLSAGQQRRVALARLWLASSPLWLLDEPFTAIDVEGADLLEEKLLGHVAAGGAAVFTSHQPNRFGERVAVLDLSEFCGA
ncbi:cytochrome c biogenesis heme-transporting ATPase CcmA [Luminiphilus syltensis]|uniref:cytochrome c biogenesis heme-transporting ATPase CcmA n=1 Tax=Luminiphilus syltensis TaxID=1341119 RepID=UPI00031081B9|nr:cytochrome c biogenesis heme-transporting ATPase CcmA [Luminiphilus syltensis]